MGYYTRKTTVKAAMEKKRQNELNKDVIDTEVVEKPENDELARVRAELDAMGVEYDKRTGLAKLKKLLGE